MPWLPKRKHVLQHSLLATRLHPQLHQLVPPPPKSSIFWKSATPQLRVLSHESNPRDLECTEEIIVSLPFIYGGWALSGSIGE